MAEQPSAIDRAISNAKDQKQFILDTGDLRNLADNKEKLKLKAGTDLKTRESLQALASIIKKSREGNFTSELEDKENELSQIETEINAMAEQKQAATNESSEVTDIATEEQETKDEGTFGNVFNKVKSFFKSSSGSMIGSLIGAYISFKKQWSSMFPPKTKEDKDAQAASIQGLEELYGRFFGAAELRKKFNGILSIRAPYLSLVEGTNDGVAFAELKVAYETELAKKTEGKTAPQQRAIATAFTFENFAMQRLQQYRNKFPAEANTKYVSTLSGLAYDERPKKEAKKIVEKEKPKESQGTTA